MKRKSLFLFLLSVLCSYSYSQTKVKPDVDIMLFLGRMPQKLETNTISDELIRALYYDVQPAGTPKIGYLNKKGKILIKPQYNYGSDFYGNYANIIKDSLFGYIDKKGKEVLFKEYKQVYFYYGDNGIANKNGKDGLINRRGDSLTNFRYSRIALFGFKNFYAITELKKKEILNEQGNVISNKDFDISSNDFYPDSLIIYQEDVEGKKLKGVANLKGKIIVKPIYEEIYSLDREFYTVKKNNKWGFIDKTGKETIPIIYNMVGFNINDNLIPVQKGNKWGFINRKNEQKIPFDYDEAYAFKDNLAFVKKGNFYGCINKYNKIVVDIALEKTKFPFFTNKLALFTKEGRYGFINRKGKIQIPAIYEVAYPFTNGMAQVMLHGKVGYINSRGKEVIPIKYKQLWFNSEGMIRFAE